MTSAAGNLFQLMQTFQRVAERKSFSAVAREQGLGQSAVSKQVAALEEHLGVRLLHRNTRELSLTDEGAAYYRRCVEILAAVDDAEDTLGQRRAEPSGTLRLSCSVAYGRFRLIPTLKGLLDRYPKLELDFVMSDTMVDLVRNGVDVAVRFGNLEDSELVAQPLGQSHRLLAASRDYVAAHGAPSTLEELVGHQAVIFTSVPTPGLWPLQVDGELRHIQVHGRVRVDNAMGVRAAVLAGLGIGMVPYWLYQDELSNGSVVRVLQNVAPPPVPLRAVYHKSRHRSPRVRALLDYLRQHLPEASGLGSPP